MGQRERRTEARVLLLLLVAILTWLMPSALAQEPCLKQVFGRYCLGGDMGSVSGLPSIAGQTDGERTALVFQEGAERVYVLAFRNRVYKVLRRYRGATQLRFDDLYSLLRRKYGEGEDRSRFPPYATTASRRLSSIRRGDGRAVHVWRATEDWHIELTWTRELGLALAYVATALDRQQEAAVEGDL